MIFQDRKNQSAVNAATWLVLAVILSVYVWEFHLPMTQLDDAFISYRYAQNFVAGDGLVFNVGERVEGYTNLLWVLLVAGGIKLGFSAPTFGHWMCVGTGMLLLWASYLYCAILLPRTARPLALLAPLLLLSFNCFVKWTSSGLEQGFFAALVVLALCAATVERYWLSTILCILATLTRPEGVLVAALLLNLPWLRELLRRDIRNLRTLLPSMAPALAFGLFVVLLTLFRWVYYADVVPNTFHAKVGGVPFSNGLAYLEVFALDGPGLLLIGVFLSAILVTRYRLGFVLWALFVVYVVEVRGDIFPNGRFMLPVLPIMVAGGIVSIQAIYARHRYVAFGLSLLLFAAAFVSLYVTTIGWSGYVLEFVTKPEFPYSVKRDEHRTHDFRTPEWVHARVAAILHAQPPIHLIASIGIGQLGYYIPHLQIVDLVGLVDKTIARSTRKPPKSVFLLPGHQRSDPDYVFGRKPDLINIPKKDSAGPPLPAVLDLWNDPRLESDYHWDEDLYAYRINR
jgi:hypothetical protein